MSFRIYLLSSYIVHVGHNFRTNSYISISMTLHCKVIQIRNNISFKIDTKTSLF